MARRLIDLGVDRGDRVAVQMERCLELPVVLLGILKAGAAYIPIDPHAPAARRDFILRAADVKLIVTHAAVPDRVDPADFPSLDVDVAGFWKGPTGLAHPIPSSATDLIYVLYTSGTTGEPKGVMLQHGGISNILTWMVREYGFSTGDRLAQKTPYTFDASVWEFFVPLISGGTVVLAEPGGHRDPRYLAEMVTSARITTLQLVPSILRHFLDDLVVSANRNLRQVFVGGESLPRALQDEFFAKLAIPLHNLYGPTETSIQVLAWTCQPDDPRPYVPIGRPVGNVLAQVLDETARPVPVGEAGQLHIGGVALARGYLGQPELTARSFITNPDPLGDHGRLYRTGDMVREHPDGTFEFLHRVDDQVKVQGFRVELGEIEAHLRQFPGVRNAAVVAVAAGTGNTRLVAHLEAEAHTTPLRELRAHLSERLPEYMIPSEFRAVERFPLTAHGKLDKAALPQLPSVTLSSVSRSEGPRTDLERKLLEIWQQTLGSASVGIRDDFFECGGNSIAGLLMIAQAKKSGIVLRPQDLFRLRRIDAIAAVLSQK